MRIYWKKFRAQYWALWYIIHNIKTGKSSVRCVFLLIYSVVEDRNAREYEFVFTLNIFRSTLFIYNLHYFKLQIGDEYCSHVNVLFKVIMVLLLYYCVVETSLLYYHSIWYHIST